MGRCPDALGLLDTAIAKEPGNARAWSNRAAVRYRNADIAGARNNAENALRLGPFQSASYQPSERHKRGWDSHKMKRLE